MNNIGPAIIAFVGSIITLSIISVLVGRQSQTGAVINAAGNSLSTIIRAAVSPVGSAGTNGNPGLSTFDTGGFSVPQTSFPGSFLSGLIQV